MRFMSMIKADKNSEAGVPPDPKLMAAIGEYSQEMMKSGVVVNVGGLAPSSEGTRIRASAGKLEQIDGPFAETKELIAGFAVIEAKSKEEAIEHARRFLKVHQDVLGPSWEGVVEIRQLFAPDDPGYCQ